MMIASDLKEAEARAALIAKAIMPLLTAELVKKPEPRPLSPREQAIMRACGVLGRAVDKLEEARTTKWERSARWELEKATLELRKLIDLREARFGRQ